MGNSLACCGKNDADPNNLDTFKKDNLSSDKIRMIIRI